MEEIVKNRYNINMIYNLQGVWKDKINKNVFLVQALVLQNVILNRYYWFLWLKKHQNTKRFHSLQNTITFRDQTMCHKWN